MFKKSQSRRPSERRRSFVEPLESRTLFSYTVPADYVLIESKSISAMSATVRNFTASLVTGADYVLVASGTAKIGVNGNNSTRFTDAVA